MTAYAYEPENGVDRPLPRPAPRNHRTIRLSIDELAAELGVTARTIRSYQARGLIQPPHRTGRTPYYGAEHLTRLRLIGRLQHRGLSLDAIRALLEPDMVLGQLLIPSRKIASVLRAESRLTDALVDCGVLVRLPDGGLVLHSARAILACGAANSSAPSTKAALWTLVDAIGELLPSAAAMLERLRTIVDSRLPDSEPRPEQITELAVEVLRLCLTLAMDRTGADQPPRLADEPCATGDETAC